MATVGLNFGNLATGTGFDVAGAVTSILAIEQGIETPWKNSLTSLQAQDTALSTIGTDLSALSTAVSSLTDFQGVLTTKLGSSSDTNVLALTSASSSSVAGSHTVVVNSLATTSSNYSDSITHASTDLLNGSLSINVGGTTTTTGGVTTTTGGTTTTVTIPAGGETLSALSGQINLGSYGVTASVISDSSGSRLSLVSTTPGTAGQLALTSTITDTTNANTPIAFSQGQPGADAVLHVDGLLTGSASNTVTTAIPGVTFQLLAASTNPIQIQIANDNGSVSTAFQSLVTAYNAVVNDVKTQEGNDSTGKPEPLFGNTVLTAIQSQLSQGLLGGAPSGAISSVTQLGLTFAQDGTLSLDNNALTSALNTNFSDVSGFLQNTGSFGLTFSKTLDNLGSVNVNGDIYLAKAQNASQEAALNANIANEESRVATQKISLTKELNLANQILQSIPSQLSEVDQIYSAVTGYNTVAPG